MAQLRQNSVDDELAFLRGEKHKEGDSDIHYKPGEKKYEYYNRTSDEAEKEHQNNIRDLKNAHNNNMQFAKKDMESRGYPEDHPVTIKKLKDLNDIHNSKIIDATRDFNQKRKNVERATGTNPQLDKYSAIMKAFGTKEGQQARMAGYGVGGALAAYTLYKLLQSRNEKDDDER